MLSIHAWWIVFPALVPAAAILAWRKRREPDTLFLLAWIGIFFAGALADLLRRLRALPAAHRRAGRHPRLATSQSLAGARIRHRNSRSASLSPPPTTSTGTATARSPPPARSSAGHRVWVDNEWGLRYYFEADHGCPPARASTCVPATSS